MGHAETGTPWTDYYYLGMRLMQDTNGDAKKAPWVIQTGTEEEGMMLFAAPTENAAQILVQALLIWNQLNVYELESRINDVIDEVGAYEWQVDGGRQ